MTEIITHELLRSWQPCADGYKRFCELFPNGADLQTAINGLAADGHDNWGFWLFQKCQKHKVFEAVIMRGYRNSGYRNSGNWNSGDQNSGDWNSGYRNSGDRNSGDRNIGNQNSGDWNSGNWNSGNWNSGNRNSGDWNSGDRNIGNRNSGDWNSGNWNSGNWNSGFFNTKTPKEILVFNKLIDRHIWESAKKPKFIYFNLTYWVSSSDMTEAEKFADPHFYVRGGQLRKRGYKEAWRYAWDNATQEDKRLILTLPNFDADVFHEISGIDVRTEFKI